MYGVVLSSTKLRRAVETGQGGRLGASRKDADAHEAVCGSVDHRLWTTYQLPPSICPGVVEEETLGAFPCVYL
ncbi:hypothetical protein E2C01_080422 [Portunus trituberculatus]|uniref:Uncharacterized protein n=1 Tax=Portunus trituberculatus TaxID=210409 RepID=A0A5B7IM70_PORTR|nr:hypothetical protein [Portunus trituberculatus]